MSLNTIDTQILEQQARSSQQKEAYRLLEKTSNFRLGVGVRLDSDPASHFFVEVTINLTSVNEVSTAQLEKAVMCLRQLESRGYTLTHQNGAVTCESTISVDGVSDECQAVRHLLVSQLG